MLAIEVEYLLGRVYAAEFRDGTQPEWPPNPARLFSALVAANHDTNGTEQEREALLWLEAQVPPQIFAGRAGMPTKVVDFVPTNYPGKTGSSHPEQRVKQPRSFPAQGPESPVVRFLWPEAQPAVAQVASLKALAERIASLGRACSFVRARVIDKVGSAFEQEPSYVPDENGKTVLSAAGEGRLVDLERNFLLGRRPEQGVPVRYRNVRAEEQKQGEVGGHFGEMIVLRKTSGIGFPLVSSSLLTKHLRKAFLSQAGQGSKLSPVLSGHDEDERPTSVPHVAFAALPNVGGNFGDGRLMGLAVILPSSISRADRRTALRAVAAIDSLALGDLGEWKVEIANFDVPARTLQPESWMKASKRWATVTPILLDRYPKKKMSEAELLVTACQRAGLPSPISCQFGAYQDQSGTSGLKGVAPVFAFALQRWAVHATFEFDEQVKGPVLVGAGRFFGMGLMKPMGMRRHAEGGE